MVENVTENSIPNYVMRHPVHLDNNGRLYTAYSESDGSISRIFYNVRDSILGWGVPKEIIRDTSVQSTGSLNLAVDKSNGDVWIAHGGVVFSEAAVYVWVYRFSADTVEVWKIDTAKTGLTGNGIDMRVDPMGNLHMVWYRIYWDSLNQGRKYAVYALYHSGVWEKQSVGDTTYHPGGGVRTLLSITPAGKACIVLGDLLLNDTLGGTLWEDLGQFTVPNIYGNLVDLDIDATENVHALWNGFDDPDGNQFFLYYYFRDRQTGLWHAPELLSDQADGITLTLDSLGEPHAAWATRKEFLPVLANVIYGNKKSGNWSGFELLGNVNENPVDFDFLIDGAGNGHGIYEGYGRSFGATDSLEIYYVHANPLDVKEHEGELPKSFQLLTNFPNPFNSTTLITYKTIKSSQVVLKVYNIRGQLVSTLVNQFQRPGSYSVAWKGTNDDGKSVSSGIYFCKLSSSTFFEVKKMLLLR